MKLAARIFFKATYRRAGGAKHTSTFYEPIESEIPELSTRDAPVSTVINGNMATRWYSGAHYARFPNPDALSLSDVRDILEWEPLYGMTNGYDCFKHETRSSLYPPIDYVITDDAGRDTALSMATTCFERVIMVDGEFWIACDEPHLYAETPDHPALPSICFPSRHHAQRPNHRSHAWLFHSRVIRGDDPRAASMISVEIPESFLRQSERDTIVDAARCLVEDYSYTCLAEKHPDVLSALTALHGGIFGREAAAVDCDRLAGLVGGMLDAMQEREREPGLVGGKRLDAYRQCVDRWNDRTISIPGTLGPSRRQPRL
jgi:hypothetical protein